MKPSMYYTFLILECDRLLDQSLSVAHWHREPMLAIPIKPMWPQPKTLMDGSLAVTQCHEVWRTTDLMSVRIYPDPDRWLVDLQTERYRYAQEAKL
jgi:hypothetical protein